MREPSVVLDPNDLLSKWGFADGDAVSNAADQTDLPIPEWERVLSVSHDVLTVLVRRFLVPTIPNKVELCELSTMHNPIRAWFVDGVDVSDRWYDSASDLFDLPCVTVPWSVVAEVASHVVQLKQEASA